MSSTIDPAPSAATAETGSVAPEPTVANVPVIAWPLVERRRRMGQPHDGPERRRSEPAPMRVLAEQALVPAIGPFRWAAVAVGLVVAMRTFTPTSYRLLAVTLALVVYAAYRTARPISLRAGRHVSGALLAELAFDVAAVIGTGAWWSPYAFSLLPTALATGIARGSKFALRTTIVAVALVSTRHLYAVGTELRSMRDAAVWSGLIVLVGVSSGWARQVSTESARQHSLALNRLGELTEANALLFSLNRVAQTLPASLDIDEVLESMTARLRDLVDFDSSTILLYEDSDGTWAPVRHSGSPIPNTLPTESLPVPLATAMRSRGTVSVAFLDGAGLSPSAGSGLYASLYARGSLLGLLVIESNETERYSAKDIEIVNAMLEPFGVTIDNARLFSRLRSIGADEERSRIARDLHDRIGQSLAHLGFELDRAVRANERGADPTPTLVELRTEVRDVVREVRETLYDVRTDVTATHDIGETMAHFLDRVRQRSTLEVSFSQHGSGRLPLRQERELWRIAKEAVVNAERHAHASRLQIGWECDGRSAELTVSDDGDGFRKHEARTDSYGIIGMRERATSIGARFEIASEEGRGTTVRVVVGRNDRSDRADRTDRSERRAVP
jgi:signal transduction histidine kinase